MLEDGHPVQDGLGLDDVVGDQQHRGAALGAPPVDGGPHGAAGDGVHAGGGLVQDEQGPLADQGGGEAGEAALAAGELLQRAAGDRAEAELVEDGVALGAGRARVQAAQPAGGLGGQRHGQLVQGRGLLPEVADEARGALGVADEVVAEELDGALVGAEQAGELADEGGLAGAVGAEEAEDLAAPDVEVDAVAGAHGGRGGGAAPAARGGVGLDQAAHGAHRRVACGSLCLFRARSHEL